METWAWRTWRRRSQFSRRFGLLLCLFGFVWGVTVINMALVSSQPQGKSSQALQEEILELSARYVKALADETQNTIDGPYAGRLTGYDLKKTMAVLLDSLLERVSRLEQQLDQVLNNSLAQRLPPASATAVHNILPQQNANNSPAVVATHLPPVAVEANKQQPTSKQDKVDAKDLLLGAQEDCTLTENHKTSFPHCIGKIDWMRSHWKSDSCYSQFGVDGSECSFRVYLSEVENWCPLLTGRQSRIRNHTETKVGVKAHINMDLSGLISKLQDPGQRPNYDWMRQRITRMWPNWAAAAENLQNKQDLSNRQQKKVMVHLGLLSKKSGFKIAESTYKGGPLGELVQWSDIISALYILGHDLTITSEVDQLSGILAQFPTAESQCQNRELLPLDMIFTDIVGLTQFKRKVRSGYGKFSCLLRIIDSFGTEPAFNLDYFAKAHKMKTQWGMQNLDPRQFYTMFPHSPDNSFMGFVIEQHLNESEVSTWKRKNQAVVYGKAEYMWQGKETYLDIIRKHVDIHATVFVESEAVHTVLPSYVHNHGILSGPDLHKLLRESKLFIGLGFPYEGPAPLEAIAQGNVFINPKFDPPHNSENTKFFKGKPTRRKLFSQHPYGQDFIGEPHVLTVDMNDGVAVEKAVKQALDDIDSGKVQSYMPYEFRAEGMLQRLSAYVDNQDFCHLTAPLWPPVKDVSVLVTKNGQSCSDACREKDLICEPAHFRRLNTEETLRQYGKCANVISVEDIYFPAYRSDTSQCVLQSQALLFSCVGEAVELRRLCPCRSYVRGQTALCKTCL